MIPGRRLGPAAVLAAGVAWTGCWFWLLSFGYSHSFFAYNRHSRIPPLIAATLAAAGMFASAVAQWRHRGSALAACARHVVGVAVAMGPFLAVTALLRNAEPPWRPSADDAMGIGIDFLILLGVGIASLVVLGAGLAVRGAWRSKRGRSGMPGHATLLVAASVLAASGCGSREDAMRTSELEALGRRYAAAWSSQDPASLAALYAREGSLQVNDDPPAVGRDAITAKAHGFMSAFPDMVVRMDAISGSGNHAVFRWTWTGTNTGPGGTGRAVHLTGYEEWTLDADGSIAESKGHFDEAEYQRQVSGGGAG